MPILWGSILSKTSDTPRDHLSKLGKPETWKSDMSRTTWVQGSWNASLLPRAGNALSWHPIFIEGWAVK